VEAATVMLNLMIIVALQGATLIIILGQGEVVAVVEAAERLMVGARLIKARLANLVPLVANHVLTL